MPADDFPALPGAGLDIQDDDGERIGVWASKAVSTVWDAPIAMAFLDRSHRTPGDTVKVRLLAGEVAAQVVLLPFHCAQDARLESQSLHGRAVLLYSSGQDQEAVSLLEQALHLDSANHDACEALGVILGNAGRYHEAIDIFRRLEESAPDQAMVHVNLSLFYMKIGDTEEAEKQKALATLKRFGVDDADGAAAREAEEKESRRRDAHRQKEMFGRVLDLDPDDSLALMGMGKALAILGDLEEADASLLRALGGQADNASLYLTRGRILEDLGNDQEARRVYGQGVEVASRRGDLMPLKEMEHRLLLLKTRVEPVSLRDSQGR
jgi:Flp pilus assembly protein TadD